MRWAAVRAGIRRAGVEIRISLTSPQDLSSIVFVSVLTLVAIVFLRGDHVSGLPLSLGATVLPSALGMTVASVGLTIMTQMLTIEREDGTLLRAKAVPGGMVGLFVARIGVVSVMAVIGVLVLLVPGMFLVQGLTVHDPLSWLTLLWVLVLGLLATIPIGAICGSLFPSPRSGGLILVLFFGVTAISGIYYPITRFPVWLRDIAQVFPVYWIGLGMRSALLPGAMQAGEIDQSWRHVVTVAVLGAWALAGLAVAPVVLRRMARRESGSMMDKRKARAMQRVG